MADFRVRRVESGHTKIRNVPIAVTPEGLWCCPSTAVIQKTLKNQAQQNKHKPTSTLSRTSSQKSSVQRTQSQLTDKKVSSNSLRARVASDDKNCTPTDPPGLCPNGTDRASRPENVQRKISVGFGQLDTSDVKLILIGKEGVVVRMCLHKNVLSEHSSFFMDKFSGQSPVSCVEIEDCEDVEIYVETIGLMYCKDLKQRLIRQSVTRVLRILKIAESIRFHVCIKSCLEFLEAAPWIGDEEESVVSSIRHLQNNNSGVNPILKRVSSEICNPPKDTFAQIMDLVLQSNDERGRREMKLLVLRLLRENSLLISGSSDICIEALYSSCRTCLDSLLLLFRQAGDPGFTNISLGIRDPVIKQIGLDSDNLLWLVEIMFDRNVADEFAVIWSNQTELAELHPKVSIVSRHLVSCITARLYVGIGKGEMLPSKDTRQSLLQVWLQPLIEDYNWLQHGCRTFDRKVVEEGIGRTILTLPLEDQQSILLSWLGSFLKVGDNCPNLQRAFEVWWRRTFIRPHIEQQANPNLPRTSGISQ